MSVSPSNILLKLDQLKKWQEEQQKRLTEDHNKRLQTTATPKLIEVQEDELCESFLPQNQILDKQHPPTIASGNKVVNKSKRPFLRKGVGLARFRMNPGEQLKANVKQFKPKELPKIAKPKIEKPKPVKSVPTEKRALWQVADVNSDFIPLSTTNLPSLESKICKPSPDVNLNASERELIIFESLEKRVDQNSFCSTNSSVLRFLSSTPHKDSPVKEPKESDRVHKIFSAQLKSVYDESTGRTLGVVPLVTEEVGDEEEIVRVNQKNIQENNVKFQKIEEYEQKLQNEYLSLIAKAIQFKEYVVNDAPGDDCNSVTSDDVEDLTEERTLRQFEDETRWSDTEEQPTEHSESDLSSIKSESDRQVSKIDVETMTEVETSSDNLLEVEKELKRLRAENLKVAKMKEQLAQQQREFERYKRGILKEVEEEKANTNVILQEERKKLAKEKMVFEQYVKDLQSKPSRKEREEISVLNSEVATLRETLKLKETKHGTTQARLRNQIKALEKKNVDLQKEVQNLTKQNARLVANQNTRKNPTDTKILHEINKNLTKLAQEQLEKLVQPQLEEVKRLTTNTINEKENKTCSGTKESLSKSLEEFYEETFGKPVSRKSQDLENENTTEARKCDRNEIVLDDGSKKIEYNNGNIKLISPDGNFITFKYYNGDLKETNLIKGTVKYYYHKSQVNHTTHADGSEVIEYPDGQIERKQKDGKCEVAYPNGITRILKSNSEEICYPDGTTVSINEKRDRIILLPNGQKEVHTNEHKRREYPDGTVKILYPNGLQETRYANGRMRIKDQNGKLLMDSHDGSIEVET